MSHSRSSLSVLYSTSAQVVSRGAFLSHPVRSRCVRITHASQSTSFCASRSAAPCLRDHNRDVMPRSAFSKQALNIHPDRESRLLWGACGPGSTVSSVASAATDIRGQCTSLNAGRAETLCHLIVLGCAAGSTNFSAYGRSSQHWFSIATCSYVRT